MRRVPGRGATSRGDLARDPGRPDRAICREDNTLRRHWVRFARLGFGLVAGLAAVAVPRLAPAQESPGAGDSPARFVRAADLVALIEFDGLDAHADAWRKSAAFKILNETPTGAMLEELFKQSSAQFPGGATTPAEKLALIKHVFKAGLVIGVNVGAKRADGQEAGGIVLVARKAYSNKEVMPIFARFLQSLSAPGTKPQAVVKGGHKMYPIQAAPPVAGRPAPPIASFWWVEETKKEDLIFVSGPPDCAEYVIETLDGKKPSALTHPLRNELRQPRAGFEPVGVAFVDQEVIKRLDPAASMVRFFAELGGGKLDLTTGFAGEAIETTTRLQLVPAEGKTTLLSTIRKILGPGFARDSLAGIPSAAPALAALSVDFKDLPTKFPGVVEKLDQLAARSNPRLKVRWREDVFAHLGTKVTAFTLPSKTAGAGGGATLPGALAMIPGLNGGADALPKAAVLIDVTNPTAFGKSLDEIMGWVNRELKAAFAAPPPPPPGGDGAAPPPPPGGGPRGRGGPSAPAPEFRLVGGDSRAYVLSVPPELAGVIPAGLRPAIRVGAKQVAIATGADVARQALEAKGNYAPPAEVAAAFGRLPGKLNWLMMVDPRESTPQILAALPGKLQAGINSAGLPAGPGGKPVNVVFQVDPDKLPAAEDIRKLLFPAILSVDTEGDALRITSRAAFPPIPDPVSVAIGFRAGMARANLGNGAGAARPAGNKEVTDGFFDVPARDPGEPDPKPAPRPGLKPGPRPGGAPDRVPR